jgi:hypothetical protein
MANFTDHEKVEILNKVDQVARGELDWDEMVSRVKPIYAKYYP